MSSPSSTTFVDDESLPSLPAVAAYDVPRRRRATFQTYIEAILSVDGLDTLSLEDVLRDRGAKNFQRRYPDWRRSGPPESEFPKPDLDPESRPGLY